MASLLMSLKQVKTVFADTPPPPSYFHKKSVLIGTLLNCSRQLGLSCRPFNHFIKQGMNFCVIASTVSIDDGNCRIHPP